MGKVRQPFFTISDIISYSSDKELLISELTNPNFDWDKIVKIASKHLIIPTIYCRLKQKELLELLPSELVSYLKQISDINRNRNKSIIDEIKEITTLFNIGNINYVLLKGSALLMGNYYIDIAERMMGDIDILVSPNDAVKANNILLEVGYLKQEEPLGHKYFGHKHLPRLFSKDKLSAIELHTRLYHQTRNSCSLNSDILKSKTKLHNYYIPRPLVLCSHTIGNFLINDKGKYYDSVNFRTVYDIIRIHKKHAIRLKNKREVRFLSKTAYLFDDFSSYPNIKPSMIKHIGFKINILNQNILYLRIKLIKYLFLINIVFRRLIFFLKNSAYRQEIIKDKYRILNLIKTKYLN